MANAGGWVANMGTGLDCFLHFPRVDFSFLFSPWVHLLGAYWLQGLFLFSLLNTVLHFKTVLNPRFLLSVPDCSRYHFFDSVRSRYLSAFLFSLERAHVLDCFATRKSVGDFCNNGTNGCVYASYVISFGIRKLPFAFSLPVSMLSHVIRVTVPVS